MSLAQTHHYSIGEVEEARLEMGASVEAFAHEFGFALTPYINLIAGSPSEILPTKMQAGADKALCAAMEFKVARSRPTPVVENLPTEGNRLTAADGPTGSTAPASKPKKVARSKNKADAIEDTSDGSKPKSTRQKKLQASDREQLSVVQNTESNTVEAFTTEPDESVVVASDQATSSTAQMDKTDRGSVEPKKRRKKTTAPAGVAEVAAHKADEAASVAIIIADAQHDQNYVEAPFVDDGGLLPLPPSAASDNPFSGSDQSALLQSLREIINPFLGKKKNEIGAADRQAAITRMQQLIAASRELPMKDRVSFKIEVVSTLGDTFKIDKRTANELWDAIDPPKTKRSKEDLRREAEEDEARLKMEADEELRLALAEERAELEQEVGSLARDPNLLSYIVDLAHDSGVVGEEVAVKRSYLVATSRLNADRANSMLREGPASSGKNFTTDKVLEMMPDGSVIRVSGASAKALFYFGGVDDLNYLKHKILYVVEAAILLDPRGAETEMCGALRSLLSDNILSYPFVNVDTRMTEMLIKHGPMSLMMTSARSNIEEELRTRLLLDSTNESTTMTRQVQGNMFLRATGAPRKTKARITLDQARTVQRLLELTGPFKTVIPFAVAISAAWTELVGPVLLRARRDTDQVLSLIRASAVLHSFQRERDDQGRYLATLTDYENAYDVLKDSLSAVYQPDIDAGVIRFIETLEKLLEAQAAEAEAKVEAWKKAPVQSRGQQPVIPTTVVATYDQIAAAMGVASKDTVSGRAKLAIQHKLVERVAQDGSMNTRRSLASEWRILKPSVVLSTEGGNAPAPVPHPDRVKHFWGLISKGEPVALLGADNDPILLAEAERTARAKAEEQKREEAEANPTPTTKPASTGARHNAPEAVGAIMKKVSGLL
jgi:hypothetical protein